MNLAQRFYISSWWRRINVAIHIATIPILVLIQVWANTVYKVNSWQQIFFIIFLAIIPSILILVYLIARMIRRLDDDQPFCAFWGPSALPRKYSLALESNIVGDRVSWLGTVYNSDMEQIDQRSFEDKAKLIYTLLASAQKYYRSSQAKSSKYKTTPQRIYIGPMAKELAKKDLDQERLELSR